MVAASATKPPRMAALARWRTTVSVLALPTTPAEAILLAEVEAVEERGPEEGKPVMAWTQIRARSDKTMEATHKTIQGFLE